MTATERRNEIISILRFRRHETADNLAFEFGVTKRTIMNDIQELSCSYPIETKSGRYGGGIYLANWYKPGNKCLSPEQIKVLRQIAGKLDGVEAQVVQSVITEFSA